MAKNNNLTDFLTDTANAIRTKKGTTAKINPQNFSSEIASIQTGVDTSDATATADDILLGKTAYAKEEKLTGTIETYAGDGVETIDNKAGKTLLTQGKYCAENIVVTPVLEEATVTPSTSAQSVTPGTGKAGLSKVTVGAIETEEKTATSNGEVTPTSGKYLSKVTVNVPSTPTQEKSVTITENGTTEVTPDSGKALSKVTVVTNVPAKTEEKTITVTENGTTTVTPSSGKDGLSKVTVTTNVPTSVIEEVSTAAEMNALLVAANVGKAYKFTGTTDDTYTNGDIYEVVQESGSVKFKVYAPYQLPQLATPTNVSASGTTVSWDAVENAESYDIYVDNTLYENTTGAGTPTGETWVLNETYDDATTGSYDISFTSNGENFTTLSYGSMPKWFIKYGDTSVFFNTSWANAAYRTITFETAPTGELLTWLQANGTKQ